MRPHHPIILILLFLLSSCSPTRRIYTAVTSVSDTTHVTVHDTVRITQVHDSIVFHVSEHVREQEVTTYDPVTGHPIQRQLTRDTDRDLNALVRHIADSLFAARDSVSSAAHAEDTVVNEEQTTDEAALSPLQLFVRNVASVALLCFSIFLIVMAIRIYRRRKNTPCW